METKKAGAKGVTTAAVMATLKVAQKAAKTAKTKDETLVDDLVG